MLVISLLAWWVILSVLGLLGVGFSAFLFGGAPGPVCFHLASIVTINAGSSVAGSVWAWFAAAVGGAEVVTALGAGLVGWFGFGLALGVGAVWRHLGVCAVGFLEQQVIDCIEYLGVAEFAGEGLQGCPCDLAAEDVSACGFGGVGAFAGVGSGHQV